MVVCCSGHAVSVGSVGCWYVLVACSGTLFTIVGVRLGVTFTGVRGKIEIQKVTKHD